MKEFIDKLEKDGILTAKRKGILQLATPLKITVPKAVQERIKAIYPTNKETGGILRAIAGRNDVRIIEVVEIANQSKLNTAYEPNGAALLNAMNQTFAAGLIPFVFHTHPTTIGHNWYDHRKQNFFLRASGADRRIAKTPLSVNDLELIFPEVIAVGGELASDGIDLAFFQGGIFPPSLRAASVGQIGAVVLFLGALSFVPNKKIVLAVLGVAAFWFLISLYFRPDYIDEPNGDLTVLLK